MKIKCLIIGLVFACQFLYSQESAFTNEIDATAETVKEENQKTVKQNSAKQGKNSITKLQWKNADARRAKEAHCDDLVFLCANARNIPDGTDAKIKIVEEVEDGQDKDVATLNAVVNNGKIKCEWKIVYEENDDETDGEQEETENDYIFPEYVFTVECDGATSEKSPKLKIMAWILTQLVDKRTGEPIANRKYIVFLLNGLKIEGTTDSDGYVRLRNLKFGEYFISIAD